MINDREHVFAHVYASVQVLWVPDCMLSTLLCKFKVDVTCVHGGFGPRPPNTELLVVVGC